MRLLCLSDEDALRDLGADIALEFQARLADLDAARYLSELDVGTLEKFPSGEFAFALAYGAKLYFRPAHATLEFLEGGEVDISRVRRVKILRVTLTENDVV